MAELVNPPSLARPRGFSHAAVAEGRVIALAGQVGWDSSGKFADGFAAQFERALDNLVQALTGAGGTAADLVSVRIYVVDKRQYIAASKEIGTAWRARLGKHYPAMALLEVKGLLEDAALVEIEGLAVVK
jgi:enamine deaminase RidA (YjgF/YER057c/UK114 family)